MENCVIVILAAGEGTRMKSSLPKVLHKAAGLPLVEWVVRAARAAADTKPIVVYGSGGDAVPKALGEGCRYALQSERRGSGHAVISAAEEIAASGAQYTAVVAGDMPLLRKESLTALLEGAQGFDAFLLTGTVENPFGYGRIVRDASGAVCRITEEKDASPEEKRIREVNLSFYCFRTAALLEALEHLTPNNAQGEYYITDCISYLYNKGGKVGAAPIADLDECMGVNDRVQLAQVAKKLWRRKAEAAMRAGATLIDPENTYLDADVTLGRDVVVYPNVTLSGHTFIGAGAVLYPGSRIENSVIGEKAIVENSVILASEVGKNSKIGPFAYLRPGSFVGEGCRVGDFVEIKNAEIKDGAKVSHLTYIGDAEVGPHTNVGCGVVFVNYDGKEKRRIVVGEDCFIGCNTNLIAPVSLGDGAYIAAGATITKDVPADSLVIARPRALVKAGWGRGRYRRGVAKEETKKEP